MMPPGAEAGMNFVTLLIVLQKTVGIEAKSEGSAHFAVQVSHLPVFAHVIDPSCPSAKTKPFGARFPQSVSFFSAHEMNAFAGITFFFFLYLAFDDCRTDEHFIWI
jgi:hypothetical protein